MPALSAKALRNAAPPETLPFSLERKYGEDRLFGTLSDLRRAVLGDCDELEILAARIGRPEDRAAVKAIRAELESSLVDGFSRLDVDRVVDEFTGVRYQVTIRDRRLA